MEGEIYRGRRGKVGRERERERQRDVERVTDRYGKK